MERLEIVALGRKLPLRMSVPRFGALVDGMSKSTALRRAETEGWPVLGTKGQRIVVVISALDLLGIPWTSPEGDAE